MLSKFACRRGERSEVGDADADAADDETERREMAGDLKRFDSVSDGVRPKDHLVRNVGHIAEDEQTAGADSIDVGTGWGARDQ